MTNQMKKHLLSQYLVVKDEYRRQFERYQELRQTFDSLKAQVLDDMPKGDRETHDKVGDRLARIEELEAKNTLLFKQYMAVEQAIDGLGDEKLKKLMRLRYIDGKCWEEIALTMNYGYRNVTKLHGKALTLIKIVPINSQK